MYEEHLLLAVQKLRDGNKIPYLNIRFPAEQLSNGDFVYTCDTCMDPNNLYSHWITFHVVIEQSDFELTTQRIDIDEKFDYLPLPGDSPAESRITARFVYRIWAAYKEILLDIHHHVEKNLKP